MSDRRSCLALAVTLAAAVGCSHTTTIQHAETRAGRVGYGVQTHSFVRFIVPVDITGVSIAADAPAQGALAEATWRASRGGGRLEYCTSQPSGVTCAFVEAQPERLQGRLLIVDPVNLGRAVQSDQALDSNQRWFATTSITVEDRGYPAPPNHGIWVVDSNWHHLYHCLAGAEGPACHEARFQDERVAPTPILATFLLGDAEIIWVHDINNDNRVLRCHVQPSQPVPQCHPARGVGPE